MVISFARMNRILEIDLANERAVLEPGVVNLEITQAVERDGYFYAPDPSSQKACTIGGNVAENAGGPHTLAYGVTTNHVLGIETVLPDGTPMTIGGKAPDLPGYDLTGLLTGSEGTMVLVTKITVRLMRQPELVKTLLAIYDTRRTIARIRWLRSPRAPSLRPRWRCWTASCCAWWKRPRTPDIRWTRRRCC